MKNRMVRAFCAMCLASVMLAGMTMTASASEPDDSKRIEEMTKWLDGMTVTQRSGPASQEEPAAPKELTADELKAYTDTMFELVNREREKAGAEPLERDSLLDEAAMIRAAEIRIVDFASGEPHTRPDGTSYKTALSDLGITGKGFGENISRSKVTPQAAIDSWMKSDGHRANILRENYGSIGIGVYQRSDGKLDWIQIFMLK